MVLVFLAPVQALDELLVGLFAVFANTKSIFFRRHVLGPALKLAVALILICGQLGVRFVAWGYLVASILGVAIYVVVLVQLMRRLGLFEHFSRHSITMPWREVFMFTIPVMSSELVYVVMHTMDAVVLQQYGTLSEIAELRAVQPLAMMNQLVMASFATLFTPVAAKMFAKNDRKGINDLYWRTAIWISVFSFPIFALTFSIAGPVTVALYGERYAHSALILAILSAGCYFNAATGFNGLTLKVYGKLRYIVAVNVATALINLGFILVLIPRYGALARRSEPVVRCSSSISSSRPGCCSARGSTCSSGATRRST